MKSQKEELEKGIEENLKKIEEMEEEAMLLKKEREQLKEQLQRMLGHLRGEYYGIL